MVELGGRWCCRHCLAKPVLGLLNTDLGPFSEGNWVGEGIRLHPLISFSNKLQGCGITPNITWLLRFKCILLLYVYFGFQITAENNCLWHN